MTGCGKDEEKPPQLGQHPYSYRQGFTTTNYLLYLPEDYDHSLDDGFPLLVFLHGIAKRGDTLDQLAELKKDGPPMIVDGQSDLPFIVLSPQCPSDSFWSAELDRLEALLDHIIDRYAVDKNRIYLTGLSMGGYGAWHWSLSDPIRFAALAPIAGGYLHNSREVPENICDISQLPTWVFHGEKDDVVLPYQSKVLVDALRACGSNIRFTLYPDADHGDSWKRAYADPELYEWMLEQKLGE